MSQTTGFFNAQLYPLTDLYSPSTAASYHFSLVSWPNSITVSIILTVFLGLEHCFYVSSTF